MNFFLMSILFQIFIFYNGRLDSAFSITVKCYFEKINFMKRRTKKRGFITGIHYPLSKCVTRGKII